MPTYAHLTKSTNPKDYKGGYQDKAYFCPVADFTSLAEPGAASAIGDTVKITTAHTFTGTKGFYAWATKNQTVTVTGEPIGDPGARLMKWVFKFSILGDSASTQEQIENQLNDNLIVLVKDSKCAADEYIQFGDECTQPVFSASFNGGTTAQDGQAKIYEVTGEIVGSKYFYTGAVTEATA